MKTKAVKSKGRKLLRLSVLIIAVALVSLWVSVSYSQALEYFEDWGWVGNNTSDTSYPSTIGWLSSATRQTSCGGVAYGMTLGGNSGDSTRPVKGYAWFGIGSSADSGGACQNDNPSIGWVNFQAGSPSFCPGDCHSAQWHKTGDKFQGYLDGWAKIVSMGNDGWVRLKGSNYGVKMKADGAVDVNSYGWNSGHPVRAAGLGWINFDKMAICSIYFPSNTKTVYEDSTATLVLERNRAGSSSVTVNLVSSDPSKVSVPASVTFPANQTSFSFNINVAPISDPARCTDGPVRITSTTAHCGNDYIDLIIQRRCSVTCSPKEATVMPGNSQTFYASVSGWSGAINWSDSGATECVESASPVSGDSHTIKTKQVGDCIMKLITVKADTACCGSDTCKLFISRPGWIETNP